MAAVTTAAITTAAVTTVAVTMAAVTTATAAITTAVATTAAVTRDGLEMAAGRQDGEFIRREEKLEHVDGRNSDLMGLER
jgi:hypothetical protein